MTVRRATEPAAALEIRSQAAAAAAGVAAREVERAVDAIVVEVLRCHEVEVAYHTVEGKRVLLPLRYEQRAGQDLT